MMRILPCYCSVHRTATVAGDSGVHTFMRSQCIHPEHETPATVPVCEVRKAIMEAFEGPPTLLGAPGMTPEQEERVIRALELIAAALTRDEGITVTVFQGYQDKWRVLTKDVG